MTVSSKVRIYDLAKELKLDTKRLIEEVRREGVDVSVPSNSVSKELAEKTSAELGFTRRADPLDASQVIHSLKV